ncbi:MAG TPA: zinc ribbon domain-containing protein [Solirubrobacterales bacterium]|nr:zinc ribbon domain-containing protein [Solirubrobacterales bacterium]
MSLAIFGITNDGLNLVATLFMLMLVVLWLALIVYTYLDARRRISDPFLIACATVASFFPYIGTAVYAIVRPPEFLEDAHERELEIKAAELRVRQLKEQTCPNCEYPVEKSYLRCPNCQRRLKDPCPTCSKPVDPRWGLCPYCETALGGGEPTRRRQARPSEGDQPKRQPPRRKKAPAAKQPAAEGESGAEPRRREPREAPEPKPEQRSPRREPDPDPRQA